MIPGFCQKFDDMSTRRTFIKNGITLSAAAGMAAVVPSGLLLSSCQKKWGPNDKVGVALIGTRNMGYTNVTNFMLQPDVKLVAMCDVDQKLLETRAENVNDFAYNSELDFPKPDLLDDFRKVLDRKDVDAVIIATPDHWHALITIMACQAGKDVYVEKPMANSIKEADMMVKAGEKYKQIIQVGQWQRSGEHWMDMVKYIQSDKLGAISKVDVWRYNGNPVPKVPDSEVPPGINYDMWLGPAPERPFNKNRFHYNFRWWWDYAGGKMTDWGVHLLDMAMWALDIRDPLEISAEGGNIVYPDDAMETPDTLRVNYKFNKLDVIWKNDFALKTNEYGMDHGLIFHGENGLLLANRGSWRVIPKEVNGGPVIEEEPAHPATGKDLGMHIRNFLDAVKSRKADTACSAQIARDVARLAHMGNIAYRTKETIHWNPENVYFNEPAANELLMPEYRKPWELPKI